MRSRDAKPRVDKSPPVKSCCAALPFCGNSATLCLLTASNHPREGKPGVARRIVQCRKEYLTDCLANGQVSMLVRSEEMSFHG